MKLLFDENLSPKLPLLLVSHFPDSAHVRDCSLKGFPDQRIWEYARINGFIIVSKDADFYQRSLLYGQPPKFIWLRIGNFTTHHLISPILKHKQAIKRFSDNSTESVLVIA
jgi:predicted nuclease of predicted toxin-antitoxin system